MSQALSNDSRVPGRHLRVVMGILSLVLLSACTVGPDYVRPEQEVGLSFKAEKVAGWVQARPGDDLAKGNWWERFNDPVLNDLMERLNAANQNIVQAVARYDAAKALSAQARSGFFPVLGGGTAYDRSGGSNRSGASQYDVSGSLNWEVDLWGKIRRQVQGQQAAQQASAAELANVRLSMQSELAQNYFTLRMIDEQKRLLDRTLEAYERSLRMNQNRYAQGVSARGDVVAAMAQVNNARAQAIDIEAERVRTENAIAVLTGQLPSSVSIAQTAFEVKLPAIPVSVPATVLQRRPDVASAERRVAQANAEIGVAQSAWFPDLNLGLSGGLQAATFSDWISSPLNFWSLGPSLAMTLLDGGARSASIDYAKASYQAEVAAYRQTVLTALQEVENAISTLAVLNRELQVQLQALAASRESLQITRNQFNAGLIDYLSVVQVEASAYSAERTALQLENQRLNTTVDLIKALGGGWSGQLTP
ncbi:efflux transporter outer membrane subunit [Advenella sp. RU8]|uniref:efflux transporter outer membrane subunit n=1 Tax=Advenella sp. RU8 TaxID=3399575 RepID=UPI003AB07DA5